MKWLFQIFIFCMTLLPLVASRADDGKQSQISAAASNAVEKLAADVLDEQIGVDLTVADFIHDTNSLDQLMDVLRQAQQIGGPRWLDDQTCQVKLAVEGPRVLETLRQIAELSGNKSPIPSQALVKRLKDWNDRTFVATGTAITLFAAQELQPPTTGVWAEIPEDARKQAVATAAKNAASKAMDELKPVEYQPGDSLGKAMDNRVVQVKLLAFLSDRPVTSVHFSPDGSVETTLAVSQNELMNAVVDALQSGSIEIQKAPEHLKRLQDQLGGKLASITGRARAVDTADSHPVAAMMLPNRPPEWLKDPITVGGSAGAGGNRLKTARQAEDQALDALRRHVESLPINNNHTIGDWSQQEPSVRRVVDQMLLRAKVTRIEYAPDGSAAVRVTLDPRDLWDELRELP